MSDERYRKAVKRNLESAFRICEPERREFSFVGPLVCTVRSIHPEVLRTRLGIRDADSRLFQQEMAEIQVAQFASAVLSRCPEMYKKDPVAFKQWLQVDYFLAQEGSVRAMWARMYELGLRVLENRTKSPAPLLFLTLQHFELPGPEWFTD